MDNLFSHIRDYANSTGADPESQFVAQRYKEFIDTVSGNRHVVEVLDETEYEILPDDTQEIQNN